METGEIKEFVKMEGESAILKFKEFRKLQIAYRISDNLIHLSELARFIQSRYHIQFELYKYLETKEFHLALMREDNILYPKSNVYLLDFKNNTFKVGKSFDITKRYHSSFLSDYLVSLYNVDNDTATEQEILTHMRNSYESVDRTRETFKYKSIDNVMRSFNSIASKHKITLQQYNSKLIDFSETRATYFKGIYAHPDIAKIIIRKYCTIATDIPNWNKLLESHKYEIRGATLNIIRDETSGDDHLFWYYNGYVFIKNMKTNYYNASRLVNSIAKVDNNNTKRLNEFLKSNKRFNRSKREFEEQFGIPAIQDNTSTETSKLKGIYVHEYLIDSVIRWASPRYELATNIFMRELPKIMYTDKPANEKIQEMKNLIKLTAIRSGETISIQAKRSQFDMTKLISGGHLDENDITALAFED